MAKVHITVECATLEEALQILQSGPRAVAHVHAPAQGGGGGDSSGVGASGSVGEGSEPVDTSSAAKPPVPATEAQLREAIAAYVSRGDGRTIATAVEIMRRITGIAGLTQIRQVPPEHSAAVIAELQK